MNTTPSVCHGGPDLQRRSANYKPNIWKHEFINSLNNKYDERRFKTRAEKLREDVRHMFEEPTSRSAKTGLVDNIQKLGLAYLFEPEIEKALRCISMSSTHSTSTDVELEELHAVALEFRLLRQHGYEVSQDMFNRFIDGKGRFLKKKCTDVKGLIELFEASELAFEGEKILEEAKAFTTKTLKTTNLTLDDHVAHVMENSSHKRVTWFDVKWCIKMYEKDERKNARLLELAKLNFNIVQASLQQDLREISRWWVDLGLIEHLSFARDRIVESFFCSVGLVFEPQHKSFRKWLTKVMIFILVLDDIYDVYGSLKEVKQFTKAVDRWDHNEVRELPQCMRLCFEALYETVEEMASEIRRQNHWDHVLPHLRTTWTNFCKALLSEAEWYAKEHIPSLQEYLKVSLVSSSGALIAVHSLFSSTLKCDSTEIVEFIEKEHFQEVVHNLCLIIRLFNDLRTSKAEQDRGDVASSIICHQRETGVMEEDTMNYFQDMIEKSLRTLNKHCFTRTHPYMQPFLRVSMNGARVLLSLYQQEDGFGVQDKDIMRKIMSSLIEPFCIC